MAFLADGPARRRGVPESSILSTRMRFRYVPAARPTQSGRRPTGVPANVIWIEAGDAEDQCP